MRNISPSLYTVFVHLYRCLSTFISISTYLCIGPLCPPPPLYRLHDSPLLRSRSDGGGTQYASLSLSLSLSIYIYLYLTSLYIYSMHLFISLSNSHRHHARGSPHRLHHPSLPRTRNDGGGAQFSLYKEVVFVSGRLCQKYYYSLHTRPLLSPPPPVRTTPLRYIMFPTYLPLLQHIVYTFGDGNLV